MNEEWTIMYCNAYGPQILKQVKETYCYPEDLEEWLFHNPLEEDGWKLHITGIYYYSKTIIFYMKKAKEGE